MSKFKDLMNKFNRSSLAHIVVVVVAVVVVIVVVLL